MKRAKRILCGLLALTLTLSLLLVGTVTVAYAAKTAEQEAAEQEKAARMAALEQKKKEQADKLKELEKQIADAKKKEDVMATKNLLDQRNQLLLEQIDDTQGQIQHAADEITRYEELEDLQYELFCEQVRS